MGVIVEPRAAADGEKKKERCGTERDPMRSGGGAGILHRACLRHRGERGYRRSLQESQTTGEPVSDGPEERLNEVPVLIHIGIGIGWCRAEKVERVFPSEVVQDSLHYEDADYDRVSDKLVPDDRLYKQRNNAKVSTCGKVTT